MGATVTDFVLSVIRQGIGARENGPRAPAPYEIRRDIVREAIVNAIVHWDYTPAPHPLLDTPRATCAPLSTPAAWSAFATDTTP